MCKQEVGKNVIKWGSIITLGGLGGTLVAGAILALFGNSFNNTLVLTPLVDSVDRLSSAIAKTENRNVLEHNLIIDELKVINKRINVNEVKLFRVISDCKEHHEGIEECKADFWSVKTKGD